MNKNEYSIYPDQELFAMLGQPVHSESAFRELYRRNEMRVWSYCTIALHNQDKARDIAQEAFVRFYRMGVQGTVVENPGAYLMRIVRNLCLDEKKNEKGFVPLENIEIPVSGDIYEQKELEYMVETALQLLPEEHKDALIMQTFSEMSYDEIARAQNVPLTTVRNRIVRAKKKLREILSPYLNDLKS